MGLKTYRFVTNQISGVPQNAVRRLHSEDKNTKTWLKLKFIEEIKTEKKKPVEKKKEKESK